MGSYFLTAVVFLIEICFGIYILALLLRLLLPNISSQIAHPLLFLVTKMTNPALRPLRGIIPHTRIDWSVVVLLILTQGMEVIITNWLVLGRMLPLDGWMLLTIAELLTVIAYFYCFVILLAVIVNWISPNMYNPMTSIFYQLASPILNRLRRIMPLIHGIDLTPMFALIVINLGLILIVAPLRDMAVRLIG